VAALVILFFSSPECTPSRRPPPASSEQAPGSGSGAEADQIAAPVREPEAPPKPAPPPPSPQDAEAKSAEPRSAEPKSAERAPARRKAIAAAAMVPKPAPAATPRPPEPPAPRRESDEPRSDPDARAARLLEQAGERMSAHDPAGAAKKPGAGGALQPSRPLFARGILALADLQLPRGQQQEGAGVLPALPAALPAGEAAAARRAHRHPGAEVGQ